MIFRKETISAMGRASNAIEFEQELKEFQATHEV